MGKIICGYDYKKLEMTKEHISLIKQLSKEKSTLYIKYKPKVIYKIGDIEKNSDCFKDIFCANFEHNGETILINLFNKDQERFLVTKINIVKYFRHLSKLYSYINVSLIEKDDSLYAKITFEKDYIYHNVILRDILTRIRYIFEGPCCGVINKALSVKNFSLNNIDKEFYDTVALNGPYYGFNSGHYFYSKYDINNNINYSKY